MNPVFFNRTEQPTRKAKRVEYFSGTLTVLLLFSFLFATLGYYPLFKIRQWEIRKDIRSLVMQQLPEQSLCCVAVTAENQQQLHWEWEWDMQEFSYKGSRYDVVKTRRSGDTTYYFCINDQQEEALESWMEQAAGSAFEKENTPFHVALKKILKTLSWCNETAFSTCHDNHFVPGTLNTILSVQLYTSHFLKRKVQPPEMMASIGS